MVQINNFRSPLWRRERGRRIIAGLTAFMAVFLIPAAAKNETAEFARLMGESMMRMHSRMHETSATGNPDHDFAAMMIPHHEGAIDMAKAELLYGKDPLMRRLAQEIIVDQQSEIEAMNLWLSTRADRQQEK